MVFDNEFVKFLATLGVGGVLAGLMFVFYRKDVRQFTDLWKNQTDILMNVVKENTASNTQLVGMIHSMHTRLDEVDDLRDATMHCATVVGELVNSKQHKDKG